VLQKIAEEDGFRHSYITEALREIYATCRQWLWKGYSINYAVQGSGPPILLVHGFGASIGHWRRCGIKFQYS
jgi:pimeloyl-ACP methyl ester carboxylesterase